MLPFESVKKPVQHNTIRAAAPSKSNSSSSGPFGRRTAGNKTAVAVGGDNLNATAPPSFGVPSGAMSIGNVQLSGSSKTDDHSSKVATSLSLASRPHSRPVGGNSVGSQRPVAKPAFGLRGSATEQPLKFNQQPTRTPGGHSSVVPPGSSAGSQRGGQTSPTRRPVPPSSIDQQQQQHQSPTKQQRGGSPVRSAIGKCYVNPNIKLTPSAQKSVQQSQAQTHQLNMTSSSGIDPTSIGGGPSTPSKFAARKLIPALNALDAVALADGDEGSLLPGDISAIPQTQQDVTTCGGGVGDHTFDGPGLCVQALAAPTLIEVDLKGFDLNENIPHNNCFTCTVPKFKFSKSPASISCEGEPINTPCTDPVVQEGFVQHVIDVNEVALDRSLEYHVFVEGSELFAELPTIDAETGTVVFRPSPGVFGTAKVHVRLADNASVNENGEIMTSPPQTFEIVIERVGKKLGSTMNQTTGVQGGSGVTAAPQSGSSPTKSGAQALINKTAGKLVSVSPDLTMSNTEGEDGTALGTVDETGHTTHFDFPSGSVHGLRYDVIQDSHQREFAAAGLPLIREVTPCFSSIICDVEKLKLVHTTQERDRLSGEVIDEPDFEQKLVERLRAEEAHCGEMAPELCPLLMRLAQVRISEGSKRHGDAIETLERICRIRLKVVGLESYADISVPNSIVLQPPPADDAAPGLTKQTSSLMSNTSFIPGLVSPVKASPNAAAGSPTTTAATPEATQQKNFEALLQSLTILATYFKLLGRFQEAIEFFEHAQNVAEARFGKDSVQYARAVTQGAEMRYYQGHYTDAIRLYEKSVASAEVLFGTEAMSTVALLHLLGVSNVAIGRHEDGIKHHERALMARKKLLEGDTDGSVEFSVAESLSHCAMAYLRYGNYRRAGKLIDEALEILRQFDTSKSVEYTLSRCVILTIIAQVKMHLNKSTEADGEDLSSSQGPSSVIAKAKAEAINLLDEAVSEASRVRGMDSIEGAVFMCDLASARLRMGNVEKSISELKYALQIFASSFGMKHHLTARTQLLLAQALGTRELLNTKDLVEQATSTLKANLAPTHRDIGVAYEQLGRVCLGVQEDYRATQALKMAYTITINAKHESHIEQLETLLCAAHARCSMPLPGEIVNRIDERAKMAKIEFGDTSPMIIKPLQNLAEAHVLNGDADRAHHALSRALKVADSMNFIYLLGHLFKPATQLSVSDLHERNRIATDRIDAHQAHLFGVILFSIGCIFENEGELADAQSTFLQAQAALEIAGLSTSLGVVECLTALGRILNREGCYGDALAYFERAYNMLLERHPKEQVLIQAALKMIHSVQCILRGNGYTLVRHVDGRHRFATYM